MKTLTIAVPIEVWSDAACSHGCRFLDAIGEHCIAFGQPLMTEVPASVDGVAFLRCPACREVGR